MKMNGAFFQTLCLFLYVTRSQCLNKFLNLDYRPFHDDKSRQLNPIIEHCGDEYFYKQLTVVTIGQELGFNFYKNIHEGFSITVQVLDGLNELNSIGWQSCVILYISIERISTFLKSFDKYSWIPNNIYVIYVSYEHTIIDKEKEILYEKIWSLTAAELWRKNYVHKSILSINGRNLLFDPFERSKKSENINSSTTGIEKNLFGIIRDLENSTQLLKRRESFGGYEANVALFPYITAKKNDNDTWSGLAIIAMTEICKRLNVTPVIFDPPEQFGWYYNGKYFGTMGRLIYHDSDLAFNAFFIKNYGSKNLEFSSYMNTDKICLIVPKRARVPEYLLIIRIFSLSSWVLIFVGNSLVALTYVGMTSVNFGLWSKEKLKKSFQKFSTRYVRRPKRNLTRVQCFLATWIFFCFYPVKTKGKKLGQRLHVAFGLMLGIVIGGCFTSKLASSFSKPAFLKNIDTLAEMDESGLEVLTSFPNLLNDVFADTDSSIFRNLNKKLTLKNSTEIVEQVFKKRNAGYLDRLHSLILAEYHTDELHVVSECPHQYHLAYPIVKGSPFLPRMNKIIGRLQNGGFYKKWFSDMTKPFKNDDSENPVVIRLPHLYIPFFILLVGLTLSGIVFSCELNCNIC